jgi:hypothetical protein
VNSGAGLNPVCNTLEICKDIAAIASYVVGALTLVVGVLTYRGNSKRERAKLAYQLYEKFYEADRYKDVRDTLDCDADDPVVTELVAQQRPSFTDYLNFFEFITLLAETKQLLRSDVQTLFQYYLGCLRRHTKVMNYVNDDTKGFEQLKKFLNETQS